jgi:hypothetical protein
MFNKKIIYNYFLLIWLSFGLVIFIYSIIDIIIKNKYNSLEFKDILKLVIPTLVIILYIISFCKYKLNKNNVA